MDLNSRSRRHLEWLIQNQPELVRDLHNSNKLEERLEERYQKALELTDRFKQERGMSDEEAFEAASDLVLAPAEKDPLAQKGQPISKEEREAIYRKLEAMAIAQERPLSRESLENVFEQMLSAIELCVAARLGTPSLILLYSAIDIAGWLNSEHRKVQDRFTEWVDKYLLPNSSLKCTALDLYGARCGLVHSYSSDSDLSRSGKVTPIGYAWKPSTALELEDLIRANLDLSALGGSQGDYFIAVQVEDLIHSFRQGVQVFLADLESNRSKAAAAYAKAGAFLTHLSAEKGSNFASKNTRDIGDSRANKVTPSEG